MESYTVQLSPSIHPMELFARNAFFQVKKKKKKMGRSRTVLFPWSPTTGVLQRNFGARCTHPRLGSWFTDFVKEPPALPSLGEGPVLMTLFPLYRIVMRPVPEGALTPVLWSAEKFASPGS